MLGMHNTGYQIPSDSTCTCVCTAACGMGSMRQQLHLDHDEIMDLNIFTNIDNEQFLFRRCMIFQPTEDGKCSCGPFTIVNFMELLLKLHHSGETVFMGKRSEAQ